MVLGFVEQSSIHSQYNFGTNWYAAVNDPFTTTKLPFLMCPSTPVGRQLPPQNLYNSVYNSSRTGQPTWGYADYGSINAVRNAYFIVSGLPSLPAGTREALGAMACAPIGVPLAEITYGLQIRSGSSKLPVGPICICLDAERVLIPVEVPPEYPSCQGWLGWGEINSGCSVDGANQAGVQNSTANNGTPTFAPAPNTCVMNCTNDSEMYSFHWRNPSSAVRWLRPLRRRDRGRFHNDRVDHSGSRRHPWGITCAQNSSFSCSHCDAN